MPLDQQNNGLTEFLIEEFLLPTEASQHDTTVMTDTKGNTTFHELFDKYSEIYSGDEGTESNNLEIPLERRSIEDSDYSTTTEIPTSYLTPSFQNVHDKESFQAHVIEQLVHMTDQGSGDVEFTTILPESEIFHHESIKNPAIVEVLENIVFDFDNREKHVIPNSTPSVGTIDMSVDSIDILPKDHHHRTRSELLEVEKNDNDKFVGFQPTEDLVAPGEETTEVDRFLLSGEEAELEKEIEKQETFAEIVLETLKIVGEFGRDLKVDDNELESTAGRSASASSSEPTTLKSLYETFEEVVTTISDGIRLSKDVRGTIDSFRDTDEEN